MWLAEPFTYGQAWVDLFMNANYQDGSFFIRGQEVIVKRGQLGWSELTLAKRWQWSRGKVRRYIGMLVARQMVVQQTSKLTSIITICNYDEFQTGDPIDKPSDGTTDGTTDEQQTVHIKEVKNLKETKKNTIKTSSSDKPEAKTNKYNFDSFHKGLAERMASPVQQRFPKQNIKIEVWADAVRKLIMIDNRTREEIINVWAWIVNHDDGGFSWADQIRTPMKLRQTDKQDMKYFDVITSKMQGSGNAENRRKQNPAAANREEVSRQLSDPDYALSKWNG
jgi:hypothetical protein